MSTKSMAIERAIELLQSPYLVAGFQRYFGVLLLGTYQTNDDYKPQPRPPIRSTNDDKSSPLLTHKRVASTSSLSSETSDFGDSATDTDLSKVKYVIRNKFWYYLFSFGAGLGYELFYASFFPIWFWNIDGAVGRRMVLLWVIIMYIGQALKDVIRWPRPVSPPVVSLEPEYAIEYGMPSTHAMVGMALPFSMLIFTVERYEVSYASPFYININRLIFFISVFILVRSGLRHSLVPFGLWQSALLRNALLPGMFYLIYI